MTIVGLWLPIVVSSILVFLASSLVWMVLRHHKSDWSPIGDEEAFLADLRKQGLAPGNYAFPFCNDMKAMQEESFQKKYETGPVGFLTVKEAGPFSMNRELGQWFLYTLAISTVVAYMVSRTAGAIPEPEYLSVFRVAGTTAFLAYSSAVIPQAIWKSLRWSTVWKEVADGFAYALLTAGAFGWLAV